MTQQLDETSEAPCCGGVLYLDDPEMGGLHCRTCDEWVYPDQEEEELT